MNGSAESGLLRLLFGLCIMVGTGGVALGLSRWPRVAGAVSAGGVVVGAILGLVPTAQVLASGAAYTMTARWPLPAGALVVGLDPLSAFFLVPVLAFGALAAVYGGQYMQPFAKTRRLGVPFFGFNLLVASLALVLVARNGVFFLISWEVMASTAALLVAYEHEHAAARRGAWTYLVVSHVGVVALFLAFLLLKAGAGSFDFSDFARTPPTGGLAVTVAVLAFIGFGSKAGFMPLHIWLPEAHAAAPSHVSALLSGVIVKLGLYGILRVFLLLGTRADWWGLALGALGLVSALVSISLSMVQRDLKRAFAYSTIENVGLIALALGLAYWAANHSMPRVAALGLAGGLLHLWNHVVMKGGMFLVAGSILHGTGTRDLERMGGLARRMPLTAAGMTIGALALSALPPLNGFVSEWLIYLGFMHWGVDGAGSLAALLVVGAMSLVGAFAAVSFVRTFGIALLGQARSPEAKGAHESGAWMIGPILVLGATCIAMALGPVLVLSALSTVRAQLLGSAAAVLLPADQASLATLAGLNLAIWALLALGGVGAAWLFSRRPSVVADTWGCGYPLPTPRMQYGGRAFAELASDHLLPQSVAPRIEQLAPLGLFPQLATFKTIDQDPLTRGIFEPLVLRFVGFTSSLAWMQRGRLQEYLSYVLVALVSAMLWVSVRTWMWP